MNRKITIIFMVLVFSILVLSGCASNSELTVDKKIVRVSHGHPANHPIDIAAHDFADYINERLGDKFSVEVYGNGLLGDTKNALELTQTGAIDYVIASTSNLEAYNKQYGMFSVPYLFSGKEAFIDFMDSDVIEQMYLSTEPSGFIATTWFDAGVRSFYANKPIKTPADMKGMKIRVQPSPLNVAMIRALDAGAVPMAYGEVYTALQQGTIDGAENNEMALTTVKHGEVAKYYSYDMHQIQPDILVVNAKFLESLTPEERKVFDEATQLAHETELEAWDEQVRKAKEIAETQMGVTFVEADVAAFQEATKSVLEDFLKENPEVQIFYEEIKRINESLSSTNN